MNKRLNKIRNTDFSIAIVILFYGWIALSGVRSAVHFIMGLVYHQDGLTIPSFIGTIINIVGIIMLLKRKVSGFILLVAVTLLLPLISAGFGALQPTTFLELLRNKKMLKKIRS